MFQSNIQLVKSNKMKRTATKTNKDEDQQQIWRASTQWRWAQQPQQETNLNFSFYEKDEEEEEAVEKSTNNKIAKAAHIHFMKIRRTSTGIGWTVVAIATTRCGDTLELEMCYLWLNSIIHFTASNERVFSFLFLFFLII